MDKHFTGKVWDSDSPIQPHLVSSSMPLNVSENSEPLQTFRSNTFDGSDKKGMFFGTEFHGLFADFFHFFMSWSSL